MKTTQFKVLHDKGATIKIKPFSDIHFGNSYCDIEAFKRYIADPDQDTYYIGLGDQFDAILPSDPRYVKHGDAAEKTALLDENLDKLSSYLDGIKDRIIGIAGGNHESQIIKRHGTDLTARLCKRLGVEYLGYSGLIDFRMTHLNQGKGGNRTRRAVIRYHHGFGGGSRTLGADLTKYAKECQYWDADLYLYGHVHRLQADKVPRLGLAGKRLVARPQQICICGTFLKTYSMGTDSTYSEEKGYPPVTTGGLTIELTPLHDGGFDMSVAL